MEASVLKTLWQHWLTTGFGYSVHLCFASYLPTTSLNEFLTPKNRSCSIQFSPQIMGGRTLTVNEMEF
jgi:hypothetical protein